MLSVEHLLCDQEDHSSLYENNKKFCDKKEHYHLSLDESQWKLRQPHDQNFPMEGKALQNKKYIYKIEMNRKNQDCENHHQISELES